MVQFLCYRDFYGGNSAQVILRVSIPVIRIEYW